MKFNKLLWYIRNYLKIFIKNTFNLHKTTFYVNVLNEKLLKTLISYYKLFFNSFMIIKSCIFYLFTRVFEQSKN